MMMDHSEHVPEKYSSYKARIFNRYKDKARMLFKAIDQLSLKEDDKRKLKKSIIENLNIQ